MAKYKDMKELLFRINTKSMVEQKIIPDETFESRKGEMKQIDDVVVVGFRSWGVEGLKSWKVEKLKGWRVEELRSWRVLHMAMKQKDFSIAY